MDADSIQVLSVFLLLPCHAVVDVEDFQVLTAEIGGIAVDEAKVFSSPGVGLDAVAGDYADLHSVVRHEIVVPAAHDLVGRIIKQVVGIEFQHMGGGQVIVENFFAHINRVAEIEPVVPEIDEADPFLKGERGILQIRSYAAAGSVQDPAALQIGGVGCGGGVEAAQADMLVPVGQRGTEIGLAVFFHGGEHTCVFSGILPVFQGFFFHEYTSLSILQADTITSIPLPSPKRQGVSPGDRHILFIQMTCER